MLHIWTKVKSRLIWNNTSGLEVNSTEQVASIQFEWDNIPSDSAR